jgi:hypothetical protein
MRNALSPLARIIVAVIAVFGLVAVALPADAAIDNAVVLPSPNSSPAEDNDLESVSCVSASWCVAVGSFEDGGTNQTLILGWDGTGWSIQSSPNVSLIESSGLYSVSCLSVSSCVAVGAHTINNEAAHQTMIQVWDGNTWTIQPSPNPEPTDNNRLQSVSCIADWNCVAVGSYRPSSNQTLVLSLTGPAPPTTTTTTTTTPADPVAPAFTG